MPVTIPTLDPATGELVDRTYYPVDEIAEMLHVHPSTVRRRIAAGEWPHLKIALVHYMSAEHIGWVIEASTHRPEDPSPFESGPPRLGIPLTDRELEGVR